MYTTYDTITKVPKQEIIFQLSRLDLYVTIF